MINTDFFNSEWIKFLEVSYDGIIIADGEGHIVYMNPASERLEEVSKDYIIGKYARDLEEEGVYEVSVTVRVLQTKKAVTVMQYKGNKQLVITGIPIFEQDKIKWVLINERDVTELNKAKRDNEIVERLANKYKRELDKLKKETDDKFIFVSNSKSMQKIKALLDRIIPTDMTILLEGESGVGKDVLANWIHENSNRGTRQFVKIDCSSLPENLLESELFGYEKGAFTGASREGKKGLVEVADGGTLFLDEIGELPLGLQVKLLRLLQDQTFLPVGSVKEKRVDIRIITATNRDLGIMVDEKSFRKDLYYRINVIPIKVPSLRDRQEDLFHFIRFFLNAYNKKYGFKKEINNKAINLLHDYQWPGNIRELSNVMERLVVLTNKGIIGEEDVTAIIPERKIGHQIPENYENYQKTLETFDKNYIQQMFSEDKTIKEMAELLKVSESTIKRKLKKYQIRQKDRVKYDT